MLRKTFLLVIALVTMAAAQDTAALVRTYLGSWNGTPRTGELFQRYFTLQADADWWGHLMENHKSWQLVETVDALSTLAQNMGQPMEGNVGVKVAFPPGLPKEQKDQAMDNLALVCSPMTNSAVCLPRGRKFFLNVSFSPKAQECTGKVSADGTTYTLVFPTDAWASTMQVENVFQKGL